MEKVILLADRDSNSWEFAEKIQKYIEEKRDMQIPLEEVCIKHFRNCEIDMHVPGNTRQKDVYFIHDSTKNPQEWLVQLLLLKDLLLSASANTVSFVLPNILYNRKDRKDKPHVPISARALANSISPGLKRIITMDLHAPQIQGFYPANVPIDNLYSSPSLVSHLKEKDDSLKLEEIVIVSPDAGGTDRARYFAIRLGSKNPLAVIDKRRLIAGEIEEMRLIGDVNGRDTLIIDDIIDSGGTACKGGQLLKKEGAKNVSIYATHGIFTSGTQELSKIFHRIMTSNTHYQKEKNVEVIDISPVFAEAIYRAQEGLPISKLFD